MGLGLRVSYSGFVEFLREVTSLTKGSEVWAALDYIGV